MLKLQTLRFNSSLKYRSVALAKCPIASLPLSFFFFVSLCNLFLRLIKECCSRCWWVIACVHKLLILHLVSLAYFLFYWLSPRFLQHLGSHHCSLQLQCTAQQERQLELQGTNRTALGPNLHHPILIWKFLQSCPWWRSCAAWTT